LLDAKDLPGFVVLLSEEIKNLGCRLGKTGPLDKKLEKSLKQDLLVKCKNACEEACDSKKADEAL